MERFEELKNYKHIYNLGVGGDQTIDVIARLDELYKINPDKVFLLIGINDILMNHNTSYINHKIDIKRTYKSIIDNISQNLPDAKVVILSILPVCEGPFIDNEMAYELNNTIEDMNQYIKALAPQNDLFFIDLNNELKYENKLNGSYSIDGIHLSKMGYKKVFEKILNFCNNFGLNIT